MYWSWEADSDGEWLSPPHYEPSSADFFRVVIFVVLWDHEVTFLDAQTCSVRRCRMSLGQWAACSQVLIHILGHTNSWLGVSPLRHSPSAYVTFYPVMVGTFTLNLAVLMLSDCWAAFVYTWHHWCIGHIPALLCCWFKCRAESNISFPTLYHISWQCHTQRCRRQKRSFSFCLLHGRCTDHACLCPEDRKNLPQFQAPSYSLFYLSLGVTLTLFICLAVAHH